jgi:hypothetical protein
MLQEKYIKDVIVATYPKNKSKKPAGIAWDTVIDKYYLPVYMVAEYSSPLVTDMNLKGENVLQQATATCMYNGKEHIVVLVSTMNASRLPQ